MSATETEVKIPVDDLGEVRKKLELAGGRRLHEAMRETNVLLDTSSRSLLAEGRALRLRRIGARNLLTLKGPVRYNGPIKQRSELEVDVGDAETLTLILDKLGLTAVIRYEKYRELWSLGPVELSLDHTPMGDFVEIEGPPEELGPAAADLCLDLDRAVQGSYLDLWERYRTARPERALPLDMVFGP